MKTSWLWPVEKFHPVLLFPIKRLRRLWRRLRSLPAIELGRGAWKFLLANHKPWFLHFSEEQWRLESFWKSIWKFSGKGTPGLELP